MTRTYPIPYSPKLAPPNFVTQHGTLRARAYLAGPMRGKPMNNFPAFFRGALLLRASGWEIENPAEYDIGAGVDPSKDESEWPITVRDMLRVDFRLILEQVNAIILLPGWENSVGAKMELAIAYHVGLPAFELSDDRTLKQLVIEGPPTVEFSTVTPTLVDSDTGVRQ